MSSTFQKTEIKKVMYSNNVDEVIVLCGGQRDSKKYLGKP